MEIIKTKNSNELTLRLIGLLTTESSPQLEKAIKEDLDGITSLVFDLSELNYTTSAGLRVFLASHKFMTPKGKMTIKNINDDIKEIFEMTGMINIFNIE